MFLFIYDNYKKMFIKIKNYYKITTFDFKIFIYTIKSIMKKSEDKKKIISVALNPEILKLLNEKTSNRSNYLDWLLLDYFNKIGEDISKIKL
jgi:recombinational DNA repair ATPase RecF